MSKLKHFRPALQWVATLLIGGFWLAVVFHQAAATGVPADFAPFYCGGEVLRTGGPQALYDFAAIRQCQERYPPRPNTMLPFIRPPFYALLMAPLSLLPHRAAQLVWLVCQLAALAGAVYLIARAAGFALADVALHTAIFYPAVAAFFHRQDTALVLAASAGAFWLIRQGRGFAAGLVLSLAAIKFHLLLLVPLAFLGQKNWSALRGLAVGLGSLAAISLAMVGPAGLAGYARMLVERQLPNIDVNPQRIASLLSVTGEMWIQAAVILLAGSIVLAAARRLPQMEALAVAWLASLPIAPHIYIADYLLALPCCLLLSRLGIVCMASSTLLLFPLVPILVPYGERFVLAAPLLALACAAGAAAGPYTRSWRWSCWKERFSMLLGRRAGA